MASSITKENLLDATYEILIEKGIKSTTMDTVAKRLKISKRTLYEIFANKDDLISQTLERHSEKSRKEATRIMLDAPNIMVGLYRIIIMHRDDMQRVNIEFFRDMDRLYPYMKDDYDKRREKIRLEMMDMFREGVRQGVFRDDVNFNALSCIMQILMESIKNPELHLPEGTHLGDIFDTMTIAFLRTISSPEGIRLLDQASKESNSLTI